MHRSGLTNIIYEPLKSRNSAGQLENLARLIRTNLPLAITVHFPTFCIGVIHAGAPDCWTSLHEATDDEWDVYLWSREPYQRACEGIVHYVSGIEAVVHGHVSKQ